MAESDTDETTSRGEERQNDEEDDGGLYSHPYSYDNDFKDKSGQVVRLGTYLNLVHTYRKSAVLKGEFCFCSIDVNYLIEPYKMEVR